MEQLNFKLAKSMIFISIISFIMLLPTCGKNKSSDGQDHNQEQLLEHWDGKSDWAQSQWHIKEDEL